MFEEPNQTRRMYPVTQYSGESNRKGCRGPANRARPNKSLDNRIIGPLQADCQYVPTDCPQNSPSVSAWPQKKSAGITRASPDRQAVIGSRSFYRIGRSLNLTVIYSNHYTEAERVTLSTK
jgi:hypothetical protein